MKVVKYLVALSLMLTLFVEGALAQKSPLQRVEVPIKFAITDKLQQTYIVTPDDEVIKFDQQGREMGRYTNNYLGDLELVDPTNPINVVLYYPDLQTLVTLDVTMNEIARTNLVSLGFFNIESLCSTNDGNLWILDGMDFRLKKIDRHGKILMSSENLMILLGQQFTPVQLLERNNRVYALDPSLGIFVFDNMGNFDKRYDIKDVHYMQMFGQKLFYLDRGTAYSLDTDLFLNSFLNLPVEDLSDVLFFNIQVDKCYLFRADGFEIWRI